MSTAPHLSPAFQQVSPSSNPATELVQYHFYDSSLRDRFHLSLLALAGLKHSGLSRVYAQRSYSKGLVNYLEVERERGDVSLEEEMRGKLERGEGWNEEEIGQIVANVAETMQFLSQQGINCTDLRPANIIRARNQYLLQGLVLPQSADLAEISISSLSPERREQLLSGRKACDMQKSSVYSLAVVCVWLALPAIWGQIQTPEELIAAITRAEIGGKCRTMLAAMLGRDAAQRPDWSQVLCCFSQNISPFNQLQSCISQGLYEQIGDLLPQFWTIIRADVTFPCDQCREIAPFPWNARCPTHILCVNCAAAINCPLCPPPKKRLIKVIPRAKAESICLACSRPFQFSSSEDWRLNYIGSNTDTKEYCSQACLHVPATPTEYPIAEASFPSRWRAANAKSTIYVGNWKSLTLEGKREKAREIRETWGFPLDDLTIMQGIEILENEKETKRRENTPFMSLIFETLERYNESMNCHFCKRFVDNLLEVRWLVCSGQHRGVCSKSCFLSALGEATLVSLSDIACPGCGGELEGRRIAETITFEDVKDFPMHDPNGDCCLCLRKGDIRLSCGHLRCQNCPDDLGCDFCNRPRYEEDREAE